MFKLIGIREDYCPNSYTGHIETEHIRDVVATFDTREDALEYIEKSKLKKPIKESFGSDISFKQKSLLRGYTEAEVEEDVTVPHNPAFGQVRFK
jgi:hypothetical protein